MSPSNHRQKRGLRQAQGERGRQAQGGRGTAAYVDRRRRTLPEDSLPIRVSVLATVLIAVGAVAVQEEFTVQAAGAAAAICAGWGVSYLRRRASNWWLKTIIAVLILVVARDFFRSLLANPYDPRIPLVRLFLWLQALHSFDLPARRDLKYSLASAVILMAVAAVYAREMSFGLFLLAFALSASVTLAVMAASDRFRMRPMQALGIGSVLAAGIILAAGGLFAAVPRSQGLRVQWLPVSPRLSFVRRVYDRIINPAYPETTAGSEREPPVFNPTGYIGFSENVDLRLRGQLNQTLVLRVRSTRPAFWRGLAFDEYTGIGWRMSDRTVDEFTSIDPRIIPRFGADEPWPADSEAVVQTFYVEAEQPNVIFSAYRPYEVYFPAGSLGVDRYAGLRSPDPLEQGLVYSVISRVPNPAPHLLRSATGKAPESIGQRFLPLPPIPGRVSDLAAALAGNYPTPYQKAVSINRYLLVNYTYDLQAPTLPPGADAVDHFLFESKRGSCEIFASAMTVLLRAAGIPARLVTGYAPGRYNVLSGYYEVRTADAHAWVEAYIPRVGWIEFEPTPSFASPAEFAAGPQEQWLLRDAGLWVARWLAPAGRWGAAALRASSQAAGEAGPWAAGAIGAIIFAALFVWSIRRARTPPTTPTKIQEGFYARMLAMLARAGHVRSPHVTPSEFAGALPPAIRSQAAEITAVFEQMRYGGLAMALGDEAHLRRTLDELRHRLAPTAR